MKNKTTKNHHPELLFTKITKYVLSLLVIKILGCWFDIICGHKARKLTKCA